MFEKSWYRQAELISASKILDPEIKLRMTFKKIQTSVFILNLERELIHSCKISFGIKF